VKELNGNPGHRALNKAEPQPPRASRVPPPPAYLTGEAKKAWQKLAGQLHRMGVLTDVDHDALARYCVTYQRWLRAEKELARNGDVLKTTKGNYVQNPWLAISNRSLALLNGLAAEFGITPSSRTRVKANPPEEEEKLEKELFGPKTKIIKPGGMNG
jgi:P27 family predicted phage terminase small subunit